MSTSDPVIVRAAGPADVDAVAPLFDAYRRFYEQPADVGLARRYLAERVGRGESVLLVAEDDGRPVGFTQLYPTFCSVQAAPILVLHDLYVDPGARGRGVGRRLLAAAAATGEARGAVRLELSTARENHGAQALYASAGWERDEVFLTYSLSLAAPGPTTCPPGVPSVGGSA